MSTAIDRLKKRAAELPPRQALGARRAINLLEGLGATSPGEIAALMVDHKRPTKVRLSACWALGQVPFKAASCYFIAVFDDDPVIVWEAAKALVAKRDLLLVPILASFVENGRREVMRTAAIHALGRLRDSRAVPVLLRAASRPTNPVAIRDHAIEALTYMGEPRTVGIAEAALRSSNRRIRLSAIHALGELGTMRSARVLRSVASRARPSTSPDVLRAASGAIVTISARHNGTDRS